MKSIIKKYRKLKLSICKRYYKWAASSEHNDGRLVLGSGVRFDVPTTLNGQGSILIGKSVRFGYLESNFVGKGEVKIQARQKNSVVELKEGTIISGNLSVIANEKITIGNSCLIGDMVSIMDSDFHGIKVSQRQETGEVAAITIEDNVWLGVRVVILKGVKIGENSVIAAGSVVTKSIPSNVVAGGVPAKVLRSIDG